MEHIPFQVTGNFEIQNRTQKYKEEDIKKYAEYLAQNIDETISYQEYLAQNLDKLIQYCEKLENRILDLEKNNME